MSHSAVSSTEGKHDMWICPQDGTSVGEGASTCELCGYTRVPVGVSLRSEATGKMLTVRITSTIGQRALRLLDDPDGKYASAEQFRLLSPSDSRGWLIEDIPYATNPIFLNGAPIPADGAQLANGDTVSLKGKFLHLSVTLLHS
jgi:hypothetical protein